MKIPRLDAEIERWADYDDSEGNCRRHRECLEKARDLVAEFVSDPKDFWSSLSNDEAWSLLSEAPEVAGRWHAKSGQEDGWVGLRSDQGRWVDDFCVATFHQEEGEFRCYAYREVARGRQFIGTAPTEQAAQDLCDAELRKDGFVLEPEGK